MGSASIAAGRPHFVCFGRMKRDLYVEADGNGGLFAYLEDTPIVTAGESVDEILDSILQLIDQYNQELTADERVEIGQIEYVDSFDE